MEPPPDDATQIDNNSFPIGPGHASKAEASESLLFNRYQIVRELGRGGMGIVMLAFDTALRIQVAVKLIPDVLAKSADSINDVRKEVLRGMALNHDNVVRTITFEQGQSQAAVVMEYVDGLTLADLKAQQPDYCFDPKQILPWLEPLCEVLDYAHIQRRFVHRDIKPRNIMLTRDGILKVADFGVAAIVADSMNQHSKDGTISGTLMYMSAQQAQGMRPTVADDIHALGATIYELLTSKPPFFRGNQAALFQQLLHVVPPTMAARREELEIVRGTKIPNEWEHVVASCLAKDPEMRPKSAGEVLHGLTRVKTTLIKQRSPIRRSAETGPHSKRLRNSSYVAAVSFFIVIATFFVVRLLTQVDSPGALKQAPTPVPQAPGTAPPPQPPKIEWPSTFTVALDPVEASISRAFLEVDGKVVKQLIDAKVAAGKVTVELPTGTVPTGAGKVALRLESADFAPVSPEIPQGAGVANAKATLKRRPVDVAIQGRTDGFNKLYKTIEFALQSPHASSEDSSVRFSLDDPATHLSLPNGEYTVRFIPRDVESQPRTFAQSLALTQPGAPISLPAYPRVLVGVSVIANRFVSCPLYRSKSDNTPTDRSSKYFGTYAFPSILICSADYKTVTVYEPNLLMSPFVSLNMAEWIGNEIASKANKKSSENLVVNEFEALSNFLWSNLVFDPGRGPHDERIARRQLETFSIENYTANQKQASERLVALLKKAGNLPWVEARDAQVKRIRTALDSAAWKNLSAASSQQAALDDKSITELSSPVRVKGTEYPGVFVPSSHPLRLTQDGNVKISRTLRVLEFDKPGPETFNYDFVSTLSMDARPIELKSVMVDDTYIQIGRFQPSQN